MVFIMFLFSACAIANSQRKELNKLADDFGGVYVFDKKYMMR